MINFDNVIGEKITLLNSKWSPIPNTSIHQHILLICYSGSEKHRLISHKSDIDFPLKIHMKQNMNC